jgi:hypothetical protein
MKPSLRLAAAERLTSDMLPTHSQSSVDRPCRSANSRSAAMRVASSAALNGPDFAATRFMSSRQVLRPSLQGRSYCWRRLLQPMHRHQFYLRPSEETQ